MAYLVHATNVQIGAEVQIVDGLVEFSGGRIIKSVPTLYGTDRNFVMPVNNWFRELAENHKDLSSYARALRHYWSFIDDQNLVWDYFKMPKNHKPTYLWRNSLKHAADNGEMAYSTANCYVNHVVQFYKDAISKGILIIENERFAPFKFEWVKIYRKGKLVDKVIHVQTTDLRIPVPKDSDAKDQNIRSLNPLGREEIRSLVTALRDNSPTEMRLMTALGGQTGLRINEVVTFPEKLVRNPLPTEKRIEIEIGPQVGVMTKFGKTRTIEIPAKLMKALFQYSISNRRLKRVAQIGDMGVIIPIFINQRRNPYSTKSVMKLWGDVRKIIRENTNIHDFHDMRASYGTYRLKSLIDSGCSPSDALTMLMGWMGHDNEGTTWKYLTYLRTNEVRKEAMTLMDTLMDEILNGYEI